MKWINFPSIIIYMMIQYIYNKILFQRIKGYFVWWIMCSYLNLIFIITKYWKFARIFYCWKVLDLPRIECSKGHCTGNRHLKLIAIQLSFRYPLVSIFTLYRYGAFQCIIQCTCQNTFSRYHYTIDISIKSRCYYYFEEAR